MEATREEIRHDLIVALGVGALVFCGGFSIMAVELLAGRLLAPFFGSSVHVWGSIIAVFMLSLSVGYLVGGTLSLRHPSLTRFGLIFLASTLTTLPVLLAADPIMEWVFMRIEDPRYGSLVVSMLLFFLPTAALGMVSPYSIRLLVEHRFHSGHVAGKLYFVSTLGSAVGTIMTSFYLVLWFEVWQIITGVIVLLAACGTTAITLDRREGAT